jgi:hypothetical protein
MKKMKKIILTILLLPITVIIVGVSKYNIELNNFIAEETRTIKKNPQKKTNTKVHIVGTVHHETEKIKRDDLYNYIDSISPTVILYEGNTKSVKRFLKKRDYYSQLVNAFKKEKKMEKPVVLKYIEKNTECQVLPYEWEIRDKFHFKHKLRKNSHELINAVIRMSRKNLLTAEQTTIIDEFLVLNTALMKMENHKTVTIQDINDLATDSLLKKRQEYMYTHIPQIAKDRKEFAEFKDFIPIHMSYWDTRNNAMVQNILKQIKLNPNKTIVVLNGFYHRYFLLEGLKKYQVEYNFTVQ